MCSSDLARRALGLDGHAVLEITEHNIDFARERRRPRAEFFDMWRHEMDHALEAHGHFAQWVGRALRQRLEEFSRMSHALSSPRAGADASRRQTTRASRGGTGGPAFASTRAEEQLSRLNAGNLERSAKRWNPVFR